MSAGTLTVLAIDPGRSKCGIAVARKSSSGVDVLHQAVVNTADLHQAIADLSIRFSPDAILVGDGTTSADAARVAESAQQAPVVIVEERFTTADARARYFAENPRSGWRRLIPVSLQIPPRPYDDYVAVILAERYLADAEIR